MCKREYKLKHFLCVLTYSFSPPGQFHEESEGEDRIVVPQRGRSTKVPVSSVLI